MLIRCNAKRERVKCTDQSTKCSILSMYPGYEGFKDQEYVSNRTSYTIISVFFNLISNNNNIYIYMAIVRAILYY